MQDFTMSRQRFTENETISFGSLRKTRAIGTDGTLKMSVFTGNEFVPAGTIVSDTDQVYTQGLRIKFELEDGSFYFIERGELS